MTPRLLIRPELAAADELSAAKLFFNQHYIDTPSKLHTLPKCSLVVSRYSITPHISEYFRSLTGLGLCPINTRAQVNYCVKGRWKIDLADLVQKAKPLEAHRVFVLGGEMLCMGQLLQKQNPLSFSALSFISTVISRIGTSCNFYAVDIARVGPDFWIIDSVQDGQVAHLTTVNPRKFYSLLYERMNKMEASRVAELVRMLNDCSIAHDISSVTNCRVSEEVVLEVVERVKAYRQNEPDVAFQFSSESNSLIPSKRLFTELGPTRSGLNDPYGTIPF